MVYIMVLSIMPFVSHPRNQTFMLQIVHESGMVVRVIALTWNSVAWLCVCIVLNRKCRIDMVGWKHAAGQGAGEVESGV